MNHFAKDGLRTLCMAKKVRQIVAQLSDTSKVESSNRYSDWFKFRCEHFTGLKNKLTYTKGHKVGRHVRLPSAGLPISFHFPL